MCRALRTDRSSRRKQGWWVIRCQTRFLSFDLLRDRCSDVDVSRCQDNSRDAPSLLPAELAGRLRATSLDPARNVKAGDAARDASATILPAIVDIRPSFRKPHDLATDVP